MAFEKLNNPNSHYLDIVSEGGIVWDDSIGIESSKRF